MLNGRGTFFVYGSMLDRPALQKEIFKHKKVYVYTNAKELYLWLAGYNLIHNIDGLNVSIKNKDDLYFFKELVHNYQNQICVDNCMSNRVYIFDSLIPDDLGIFEPIIREWQEDFKPAPDSIFRRL